MNTVVRVRFRVRVRVRFRANLAHGEGAALHGRVRPAVERLAGRAVVRVRVRVRVATVSTRGSHSTATPSGAMLRWSANLVLLVQRREHRGEVRPLLTRPQQQRRPATQPLLHMHGARR